MATKPLLPEVIAERAKAAHDYHNAHQAAIDRIDRLRAARQQRDAALQMAQTDAGKPAKEPRAAGSTREKRARPASAGASSGA